MTAICATNACSADDITIEDTMQVQVEYANNVSLNYTLCAYSPWKGSRSPFTAPRASCGTKHTEVHGVFGGSRDKAEHDMVTTLHLHGERPRDIPVWQGTGGGHGGADPIMLGYLFDPAAMEPDRYNRASTHREGRLVDPHRHRRQSIDRRRGPCRCRCNAEAGGHYAPALAAFADSGSVTRKQAPRRLAGHQFQLAVHAWR